MTKVPKIKNMFYMKPHKFAENEGQYKDRVVYSINTGIRIKSGY